MKTQAKSRKSKQAKPFCALCKFISDKLKDLFAPYLVMDNYGTKILCWTMKDAEKWLSYCGDKAYILETYDYQTIVRRLQHV